MCTKALSPAPTTSVVEEATSLSGVTSSPPAVTWLTGWGGPVPLSPRRAANPPLGRLLGALKDNKEAVLPCWQSGTSHNFSLVAHTRFVKVSKHQVLQRQRVPLLISIFKTSASKITN